MWEHVRRAKEVYLQLANQAVELEKKEDVRFWRWWAWLGSFGLGAAVFVHLLQSIRFEYRSYKNAVGYPAFTMYPERQEFYFYLIALAVIPIFALLGHALWQGFLLLQKLWLAQPHYIGISALSFLGWWLIPLSYLLGQEWQFISLFGVAGALFAINSGFLLYGVWQKARPDDQLPSPGFHLSVGALGSSIGIFLLTTPHLDLSRLNPFSVLLATAAFAWCSWMLASWYLSRSFGRSLGLAARFLAIAYLPLALLALQPALWLEVWQGEQKVEAAGYGVPYGTEMLLLAVLIGMAGAALFAFRKIRSAAPGQDFFKRAFLWAAFPLLIYGLAYLPNIHFSNFYYSYGVELFHEGEKSAPANAIMRGEQPYKEVFFIHGLIRNGLSSIVAFKLFGSSIRGMRFLMHLIAPLGLISVYYVSLACLTVEWAIFTAFFWLIWFPGGYIIGSQGCDRIIWAYLSLCLLIFYLRKGAAWLIIPAAVMGAVAFMYTVDSGLSVIPASLGVLTWQAIFSKGQGWRRARPVVLYLAGLALGFFPLFLYLLRIDGLSAFWKTHRELLIDGSEIFGLPWPIKFFNLMHISIIIGII
ncbi:MAG: hypothetical protein ACUVV0_16950, partial [Anaerolineae bacterium]